MSRSFEVVGFVGAGNIELCVKCVTEIGATTSKANAVMATDASGRTCDRCGDAFTLKEGSA